MRNETIYIRCIQRDHERKRKPIEKHTRYEYPTHHIVHTFGDMVYRICNLFWINRGVWHHRSRTYRNTDRNRYYGGDIRGRNQRPIILYTKGWIPHHDPMQAKPMGQR